VTESTRAGWREHVDSAGAVYGSLLAASVVVGQSPLKEAVPPPELALVLITTGIVFWLLHVYSRAIGHVRDGRLSRATLELAAREESPVVLAAVPPAAAALLVGALGRPDTVAAWWAFLVAVVGQVGWAVVATRQAGASSRVMALSVLVNLALGLVLVVLKVIVGH
jgi:hypothetical protein